MVKLIKIMIMSQSSGIPNRIIFNPSIKSARLDRRDPRRYPIVCKLLHGVLCPPFHAKMHITGEQNLDLICQPYLVKRRHSALVR